MVLLHRNQNYIKMSEDLIAYLIIYLKETCLVAKLGRGTFVQVASPKLGP